MHPNTNSAYHWEQPLENSGMPLSLHLSQEASSHQREFAVWPENGEPSPALSERHPSDFHIEAAH